MTAGSGMIAQYLTRHVVAGAIPGASWVVACADGLLDEGAVGRAVLTPGKIAATTSTIYDLASLTKPLVTSMLYLRLRHRLGIADESGAFRFLPELDRADKRVISVRHLLTHTSGLPAWLPFYVRGVTAPEYLAQLREPSLLARPGTEVLYSDAGYIAMGEILSRAATTPLERLARESIFDPLGLVDTCFNPPPELLSRVAATEESCQYERALAGEAARGYTGFRDGVIRGEVHDQNAWVLGGVAGHAGLFSTARETSLIAAEFLAERERSWGEPGPSEAGSIMAMSRKGLLENDAIRQASIDQTPNLAEARTFAFRVALRGETAAGPDLPARAFGHNGFTGTSIWIDPGRPRVYVLLTNRVHPVASRGADMLALRRGFHSLASRI